MAASFSDVIEDMIRIRRDIHKHPETGFKEVRTQKLLLDELKSYGCENIRTLAITGILVDIKGEGEENGQNLTVALRADLDALPMTEMANPEHKSQK